MLLKQPALPFFHPVTVLATWFGSGLLPKAPGTWGSLAALLCAWPLFLAGGSSFLLGASVVVFVIGIWVSQRYADALQRNDPGEVVIDEVAGQWLSLVPLGFADSPEEAVVLFFAGFLLFRLFDIWKPWPIGLLDRRIKGGLGIMVDDVVAGLYAAVSLMLIHSVYALVDMSAKGL